MIGLDGMYGEWNGKQVTAYGGECVALVAEYCHENSWPIVWGNAIDWANNPIMLPVFEWVLNIPSDLNQLPTRGDIIIWNASLPGSGGFGHIAIWDKVTGVGTFQSFDQNWGGAEAHIQQHNWLDVLGWFTPKPSAPVLPVPAPDPAPSNPAPVVPPPAPEPAPTPAPVVTPYLTPPAVPPVITLTPTNGASPVPAPVHHPSLWELLQSFWRWLTISKKGKI